MDELTIDLQKYGQLLAEAAPGIIESPEEHERLLTLAEALMDKGDRLTAEERKLLELMVVLIEIFEREVEAAEGEGEGEGDDDDQPEPANHPAPFPHETLERLLKARDWGSEVLNDIFGNPRLAADALAGRKTISRGQAKALGQMFRVPPKLFLRD